MSFNFVTDRIVAGRAFPTLATFQADPYSPEWQQFIQHSPYTIPVDLFDYCKQHNFSSDLHTIEKFPPGSFYVIAPGIFREQCRLFWTIASYHQSISTTVTPTSVVLLPRRR
jgi:hypothetical protein